MVKLLVRYPQVQLLPVEYFIVSALKSNWCCCVDAEERKIP